MFGFLFRRYVNIVVFFFRLVIDFIVRLYIFFTIDIFWCIVIFDTTLFGQKKKERKKTKTVLANVHDINLNMNKE